MTDELIIRRILVALDDSTHSQAALEAAGRLAALLHAELVGLFVEDANRLQLSEFAFAHEVDVLSAHRRRLDRQHLERQLRVQAGTVHRALEEVARRLEVKWSFRVRRGQVSSELLAATSEADMVILGKFGRSLGKQRELGSTAHSMLSQARCLALFLKRGAYLRGPVAVVYDGSPTAAKALAAAVQLVEREEHRLIVLIPSQEESAFKELRNKLDEQLRTRRLEASYRRLDSLAPEVLMNALAPGGGLLVLPGGSPLLGEEEVENLLRGLECPALVVR